MNQSATRAPASIRCTLDHIAMNVSDLDGMLDFYTRALGLEPERLEEFRAGTVPFPSVRLNADTVIDLFPPAMWQGDELSAAPAAMNHFCITVNRADFDSLVARLSKLEAALDERDSVRWGAHGSGQSRYLRDPDGNRVEIRYY